jgi:predicted RNase H-like nuclease (RuvC/YqgF family)
MAVMLATGIPVRRGKETTMSIWDDAKKNLAEWYAVTADKTSELAKVTSRRYDKFGLSRDMERQFSELGSVVYLALQEERTDVLESPEVADLVARIADLERDLRRKEEEIEEIRREHAVRKAAAAAAGATAGPVDGDSGDVAGEEADADAPTSRSDAAADDETDPGHTP